MWEQGYRYDTMVLVGCDFDWETPKSRFKFLDLLIDNNKDLNYRYSLFSEYLRSFESEAKNLEVFEEDFFVYVEKSEETWSGYFTTKPRLKLKIKNTGNAVRSLRAAIMQNLPIVDSAVTHMIADISENFALLLHHDAITGTAVEKCDDDYFNRITDLENNVYGIINALFKTKFRFCDFNDVRTKQIACPMRLTPGQPLYLRAYNPTPTPLVKSFEIALTGEI